MGKETRNFRQSKQSRSGDQGAQTFAKVNRGSSLYGKITNFLKVRGKPEIKDGQS